MKDKFGYPVTGLRQQDFTLQDNGRPGTIVAHNGRAIGECIARGQGSFRAPDPATQSRMISQANAYVAQIIARLPNFLAERVTVEYGEAPRKPGTAWKTVTGDTSLYAEATTKATTRFRDGKGGRRGRSYRGQATGDI